MRKVNRILVPIDFSEESVRALKYAVSLAEETSGCLVAGKVPRSLEFHRANR